MEVNTRDFLATLERFGAHTALTDHALEVEVLHHLGLVRFLADGGGRAGRNEFILFRVQPGDDRPAVVDDPTHQDGLERLIDLQIIPLRFARLPDKGLDHPLVDDIPTGDHDTVEQYRVADLELPDDGINDGNLD